MMNRMIKYVLVGLILFTPIIFGSMEVWAFSIMELAILFMIVLKLTQSLTSRTWGSSLSSQHSPFRNPQTVVPFVLLSFFLCLILFQMVSLPPGIMGVLSSKTLRLGHFLSMPESPALVSDSNLKISFVPFATRVEFFKWFALVAFFLFLLSWDARDRVLLNLIPVVMAAGVGEAFYGMFEFFTGHRYILNLEASSLTSSVTGTFINPNYFAGYLLMVIPVSMGYLFSRSYFRHGPFSGWRQRLLALEGKDLLISFGILVMILGLLFSASRMGILSLLLSLGIVSLFSGYHKRGKSFSPTSLFLLALGILWAGWIGLDAVIGRFFSVSEDFQIRWRIWSDTFRMIKDFPLLGTGLGTFFHAFPLYQSFHIRGVVTHAENDLLQLISEVGILGIGVLLGLFFFLLFHAARQVRSLSHRDPRRSVGIGGMVGILALMFHSLVERNIQVPANAFLFTFIWALVLRIGFTVRERQMG